MGGIHQGVLLLLCFNVSSLNFSHLSALPARLTGRIGYSVVSLGSQPRYAHTHTHTYMCALPPPLLWPHADLTLGQDGGCLQRFNTG